MQRLNRRGLWRWLLLMGITWFGCAGVGRTGSNDLKQTIQQLSALSLEQLLQTEVTSVTRSESTVGQSAAAVHVITAEDIRRSGATTIAELLRQVPGIHVARIDGNKWDISARGFTEQFGNKLLVQLDGRTVYNPVFTGVFWDVVDFPLEDIERIEVIRGPGASVWGANAVIGVINIITKRAADTQGSLVVAGGGTEEQGFGTLRYGDKPRPDLAYRVYVKGFHREEQFAADGDPNGWWWGASGVTLAFPIAGEGGWVLTLLSADTSVRVAVLYTADGSTPRRGAQPVATAPGHDGRKGSGLAPLG